MIISIFWIIILLVIINFYPKKTFPTQSVTENKNTDINEDQCNLKTKIFEENEISLYHGNNSGYNTSLYLKDKNKTNFELLTNNINFNVDGVETYITNVPDIILYQSSFGDMGVFNSTNFYINTKDRQTLEIENGNGYTMHIYDKINDFNSIIQISVNDQCNNKEINKAWVKDINLNGYPQNIFGNEYEILCIPEGEFGELVYLTYQGINTSLDKIFFTYKTTKSNNANLIENYSYNLKTHKITIEEPSNLLKLVKGQHLDPFGKEIVEDKNLK